MAEDLHQYHRERMRNRIINYGLDSFEDHELLEVLLYSAYPRKNTNDIAHRLLRRYNGFKGIFSAEIDDLMLVEGIGRNTAVMIKVFDKVLRRLQMESTPKYFSTYEEIGELFTLKLANEKVEKMILLLFTKRGELCREIEVASGSDSKALVNIKKLVSSAACAEAHFAAVAHNHPNGILRSSFDDKKVTVYIRDLLKSLGVNLVDHFIVADGKYTGILKDDNTDYNF